MLLSTWVMLPGLPLTPGGDIDRAGLRLIATAQGRPERFWLMKEIRAPMALGQALAIMEFSDTFICVEGDWK